MTLSAVIRLSEPTVTSELPVTRLATIAPLPARRPAARFRLCESACWSCAAVSVSAFTSRRLSSPTTTAASLSMSIPEYPPDRPTSIPPVAATLLTSTRSRLSACTRSTSAVSVTPSPRPACTRARSSTAALETPTDTPVDTLIDCVSTFASCRPSAWMSTSRAVTVLASIPAVTTGRRTMSVTVPLAAAAISPRLAAVASTTAVPSIRPDASIRRSPWSAMSASASCALIAESITADARAPPPARPTRPADAATACDIESMTACPVAETTMSPAPSTEAPSRPTAICWSIRLSASDTPIAAAPPMPMAAASDTALALASMVDRSVATKVTSPSDSIAESPLVAELLASDWMITSTLFSVVTPAPLRLTAVAPADTAAEATKMSARMVCRDSAWMRTSPPASRSEPSAIAWTFSGRAVTTGSHSVRSE